MVLLSLCEFFPLSQRVVFISRSHFAFFETQLKKELYLEDIFNIVIFETIIS